MKIFSNAVYLNPCLFQIAVILLIYNIHVEPIQKALTINKTFSVICLSLKRLKYKSKHEQFGQIY